MWPPHSLRNDGAEGATSKHATGPIVARTRSSTWRVSREGQSPNAQPWAKKCVDGFSVETPQRRLDQEAYSTYFAGRRRVP